MFISDCLNKLKSNTSPNEATRALNTLAVDNFALPGDPGFPMNSLYTAPRDRNEVDFLRGYLSQFRQELAARLLTRVYPNGEQVPNKYWLAFTRKRFMNKSLS